MDNYSRRSVKPQFNGRITDENTIWDKLSRIFTFGCIETSHNGDKRA